jgi:membrane protein DedA with SNARE-associated domain
MEQLIIDIMNNFGYIGIMFLIAIENIFPPIPSEVILTFGGFMTTYTKMNFIYVVLFSTLGSIIGATLLYYIGRLLSKERIIKIVEGKIGKILRLKKQDIEKSEEWFNKRGIATVFFCRFIPIVRSLISIPAGMAKMKFSVFILFTTFGSIIWNTVLIYLGKITGNSWNKIADFMNQYSKIGLIFLIILFIILVTVFYYKRNKKQEIK